MSPEFVSLICLLALTATVGLSANVQILGYEDNDCLGPVVANVTTTYDTCATVNGWGTVQINKPTSNVGTCAYMIGYGDSNCTVQEGNMFAINSACGSCQGATYGVQCNGAANVEIATYCVDNLCQDCNQKTPVKPDTCTFVADLGYVMLSSIQPCVPISYTLYYSADWCDENEQQILPFVIPSGTCNSGMKLTVLD